jgi:hypothetical protein
VRDGDRDVSHEPTEKMKGESCVWEPSQCIRLTFCAERSRPNADSKPSRIFFRVTVLRSATARSPSMTRLYCVSSEAFTGDGVSAYGFAIAYSAILDGVRTRIAMQAQLTWIRHLYKPTGKLADSFDSRSPDQRLSDRLCLFSNVCTKCGSRASSFDASSAAIEVLVAIDSAEWHNDVASDKKQEVKSES